MRPIEDGKSPLTAKAGFLYSEHDAVNLDGATVVLAPVPFERTSSHGRGSSAGPAAILAASQQLELYDADLGFEPWAAAGGIATLDPLAIDDEDEGETVMAALERVVAELLGLGKTVVTLAGEHTGVVGAIRAHCSHVPDLTVLQLDAHSDMRATYLDDPWNHACTMARVLDFHRNIVQVGIRSESREDSVLVREHQVPVFRGADIHRDAGRGIDWVGPIIDACSSNVYVTLDCDVLDPAVIPATGTPEPGGLTWAQLNELLERLCRARRVVGFDVSELAPIPGVHHPQFTMAKLIHRLIGWIVRDRAQPWGRSANGQ